MPHASASAEDLQQPTPTPAEEAETPAAASSLPAEKPSNEVVVAYDPMVPIRVLIEYADPNKESLCEAFQMSVDENESDLVAAILSLAISISRDNGLPTAFIGPIAQCIAMQVEGQLPLVRREMYRDLSVVELRLQVRVDDDLYTDRLEWDLTNGPEAVDVFVDATCRDLGLDHRWASAIAVHLREKILEAKRQLRDGLLRSSLKSSRTATIDELFRDPVAATDWSAKVMHMTEVQARKWEADVLREERAKRRKVDLTSVPPSIIVDLDGGPKLNPGGGSTLRTPGTRFYTAMTTTITDMPYLAAGSAGITESLSRSQRKAAMNAATAAAAAAVAASQGTPQAGGPLTMDTVLGRMMQGQAISTGVGRPHPKYEGPLISIGPGPTMLNPVLHSSFYQPVGPLQRGNAFTLHAGSKLLSEVVANIIQVQVSSQQAQGGQSLISEMGPPPELLSGNKDKKRDVQQRLHAAVKRYRAANPSLSHTDAMRELSAGVKEGRLQWSDYSDEPNPLKMPGKA
jgi:hypothetical protein